MTHALVWVLTLFLLAAGLAGVVLPGLPGAPLVLAGALLHKLLLPGYLSWWTIAALVFLAGLTAAVDAGMTLVGGAALGAGRWGMIGAVLGAIAGVFLGPLGLAAGAFVGAVAGEALVAKRPLRPSLKAGLGAALGLLASAVGRIALALTMLALFLWDCLV